MTPVEAHTMLECIRTNSADGGRGKRIAGGAGRTLHYVP